MKVLLVSDAGSIHTKRWSVSLREAGIDVVLFSITPAQDGFFAENGVKSYIYDLFRYKRGPETGKKNILAPVTAHIRAVDALKNVLGTEKPDILHAHYATSYGLVAALSGFHPFIVSVWGSDIYEFPGLSPWNRMAVKFILGKADRVLSTSHAMAEETLKYCRKDIGITPFGVDTDIFRPVPEDRGKKEKIVFGTVKTLSSKYGIDLLLRAFALMRRKVLLWQDFPQTELVIAGKGPDRAWLEKLAEELGIADSTVFLGEVSHDAVPEIYSSMDVAVFLSRAESFGVSAVEAMACGVPVIASDADGFREILEGGAGIIVPRENVEAAADAMLRLASDAGVRAVFGPAGRKRVMERYRWQNNVSAMIKEYARILL